MLVLPLVPVPVSFPPCFVMVVILLVQSQRPVLILLETNGSERHPLFLLGLLVLEDGIILLALVSALLKPQKGVILGMVQSHLLYLSRKQWVF